MKTGTWFGLALAAVLVLTGGAWAEDPSGQLVRFKAGEVSFTLLQSDGITPMGGAELKMLADDDSRVRAEAVADRSGQAKVDLADGRYLLNVSGRTLAVLEAAGDATLTSCRVVVPDAAMMVAGAAEEESNPPPKRGAYWLKPVMIGGMLVFTGIGGYAIYDHNNDDDDDDVPPPPEPLPATRTRPRASRL